MKKITFIILATLITVALSACTISQRSTGGAQEVQSNQFVPAAEVNVVQGGTVVKIDPASSTINAGETVQINIMIENVTNLFAADIKIEFNASVLQAQDADPNKDGTQMADGGFLKPDFPVANTIDNGAGTGQYAIVQVAPTQPVDGTGVLASITFDAVADGTSEVKIVSAELASGEGSQIQAQLVNGTVQVGSGGGEPPTATPTEDVPVATDTPAPPSATDTPVPPTTEPPVDPTSTTVPPTVAPTTVPPTVAPTTIPPTPVPPTYPPPVSNVPSGATIGFCYVVQYGDTLYSLGQRFGINYHNINIASGLWPPNHIYANQSIFIPIQMGQGPNFYIAQSGDTLASIAQQCHLPLDFMARMNRDVLVPYGGEVIPGLAIRIQIPPFVPPSMGSPVPRINPGGPRPCTPQPCGTPCGPCWK